MRERETGLPVSRKTTRETNVEEKMGKSGASPYKRAWFFVVH